MSQTNGGFFPGNRRKVELVDWDPLLDAQDNKRVRLDILMPLTNQPVLGAPEFVFEGYEKMSNKGSAIDEIDIGAVLEGMTLEAFSTDQIKQAIEIDTLGLNLVNIPEQLGRTHVKITAATLRNFKLVRVTRDKQSIIALKFSVTVKSDAGLVLWAHTYHGGTFWGMFTQAQPEVPKEPPAEQMNLRPQEPTNGKAPTAGGKNNPEVSKAIAEADTANAASIAKGKTSNFEKPQRPRGF